MFNKVVHHVIYKHYILFYMIRQGMNLGVKLSFMMAFLITKMPIIY